MHMMDAHRKYIQIAPKHGYIEKKKRQSILMNGNPTNFMDDPRV